MSEMASEIQLLRWLEISGALASLKEQSILHRTSKKSQMVYRLSLHLDPLDLLQFNAELGDLLLHHPRQFWSLATRLCYTTFTALDWLPSLSSPSQLLLELRLSSLPPLPDYAISKPSDFPSLSSPSRFLSVTGVVVSSSLQTHYTQSASFHCSMEGCSGSDRHYIKLHVVGSNEATTVKPDINCSFCNSPLSEDLSLRTLDDKIVIQLVPVGTLINTSHSLTRPSYRQQAITIIIRGEMCERVKVGREYHVIGVPVHTVSETSSRAFVCSKLEANNMFVVKKPSLAVEEVIDWLPTAVTDILSACSYSPWTFSATLAYSFAADIVPPGAYHHFKLAMLLSLVSSSSSNPIHLFTVAKDTTSLSKLLIYGSSLASRSTMHSMTSDLWGTTRKEEGEVVVEGGHLLLASGGVCVVGDLSLLKKEKLRRLQHTLERSEIRLAVENGGRIECWPLSCAVWTLSSTSKVITEWTLYSCMGLTVFTDPPSTGGDEFLSNLISQHLLEQATVTSSPPPPPPLSHSQIYQLISVVSGVRVKLSKRCQDLLTSFYLASRRQRISSVTGTDIPRSSLDIMTGLAEAHARLSLRQVADEEDGVIAILLYEECLIGRYGNSVLNHFPSPHFTDSNLSSYLGRQFHDQMMVLKKEIFQFSQSSNNELPLLNPEE